MYIFVNIYLYIFVYKRNKVPLCYFIATLKIEFTLAAKTMLIYVAPCFFKMILIITQEMLSRSVHVIARVCGALGMASLKVPR